MPVKRTAFGITYYSYSLHAWRALRTPHDIPRAHWPILQRPANNHQRANRIDPRAGAIPQLGGVDHIGAGFQDNNPIDLGAERLTEYGLNPSNTRASWHAAVDSNTICLLAPPDTRPWVHGVVGSPHDMNSYALGIEDGILSPNWNLLPEPKRTAHYRTRAAWWALWFGYMGWPLVYTPNRNRVWELISQGRSWGLTQHGDLDPANRSDAGIIYSGGRRVNTFDYDRLFAMIREEMAIRSGGQVATPSLPPVDESVKALQVALNEWGNNLDVDGSPGPLTTAAAQQAATDIGYTGDVSDAATLTKALGESMSKLDEMNQTLNYLHGAIMGKGYRDPFNEGGQRVPLANLMWANGHRGSEAVARLRQLEATTEGYRVALEALATSQGLDAEQIRLLVEDGVSAALGKVEADVRLTINGGEQG